MFETTQSCVFTFEFLKTQNKFLALLSKGRTFTLTTELRISYDECLKIFFCIDAICFQNKRSHWQKTLSVMKLVKSFIILFVISYLFGADVNAQNKSDFGVLMSKNNRFTFEYRKLIKEKYRFKIGISTGSMLDDSNHDGTSHIDRNIVLGSDSLIIERVYSCIKNDVSIKFGLEKQIKSSLFSYGLDLFVGYQASKEEYYNQNTFHSIDGNWEASESEPNPMLSSTSAEATSHYIVPGLQFNFMMNVSLSERFVLNLFVAQKLTTNALFIGEKIDQDPYNEFTSSRVITVDVDVMAGIGIRYQIGKKNSAK